MNIYRAAKIKAVFCGSFLFHALDELVGEVNRKGLEGWRPQGGLSVLPGTNSFIFLQALLREEEDMTIVLESDKKLMANHQEAETLSSKSANPRALAMG